MESQPYREISWWVWILTILSVLVVSVTLVLLESTLCISMGDFVRTKRGKSLKSSNKRYLQVNGEVNT